MFTLKDILIEQAIEEKRAYADKNPKISGYEALKPYSKDKDIYVTYTDVLKVGLYPLSGYNTPIGIYTYPLKEIWPVIEKKKSSKAVPFGGDRKYIMVMKLVNKKGFVENLYTDYTSKDYDRDMDKLRKMYGIYYTEKDLKNDIKTVKENLTKTSKKWWPKNQKDWEKLTGTARIYFMSKDLKKYYSDYEKYKDEKYIKEFINDVINAGLYILSRKHDKSSYHRFKEFYNCIRTTFGFWLKMKEMLNGAKFKFEDEVGGIGIENIINKGTSEAKDKNPATSFWNVTRLLSYALPGSQTVNWNTILRKLGYTGFADKSGRGIIHPAEPIQAVFLSKKPIKVVDMVLNKEYEENKNIHTKEVSQENIKEFYNKLTPYAKADLYSSDVENILEKAPWLKKAKFMSANINIYEENPNKYVITWHDGLWQSGKWKDKDVEWKIGGIYDPKFKKFIDSTVSPEQYFKKKK